MLLVPARFLLATLCCLPLHTVAEAEAASKTPPAAEPSVAAAEALRERGIAAHDAGHFEEALRHYDEAYRLEPNDASILMLRGAAYKDLGRCKEAIADFDAFETQHNIGADFVMIYGPYNDRAYCHMQLENYRAAAGDLEDQVLNMPEDDWAWAELGRAYGFLKRYEESEAALKQAIKLNPDDPYGHYQLGLVYLVSGRSRDAIPYLQTTVRLEPGNKEAKSLLDAAVAETSAKPASAASSPAGAKAAATAAAKPASSNCKVAGVQLGVDTVASVERDIQARGGSPSTGGSGPAKFRMSAMSGNYQDAGFDPMAVNYDFDAAGPAGRLVAVTIVNHANTGPGYETLLASRKAAATAIAGPLQEKSATELVASGPGCQLRMFPNAGTWYIHEVYQLPY